MNNQAFPGVSERKARQGRVSSLGLATGITPVDLVQASYLTTSYLALGELGQGKFWLECRTQTRKLLGI
jgi:hypothetical protein